ncbi:molybdate ABC transporter substrate-binding protein [Helicobacter sp. 16-1353]|uniref:molybdate ABC transporter substrate-binding protein n=1 Tax=Helicobacter sp. 16-1353 TaxID=2004996 RepID=UPI000DCB8980|nr:molybdate ABC transporter substrate-binding protein [Helicobacter sp. 16-1353]RAX52257.1 molybdate ABC transporter substrate-binding protein [Helicobacter sp. 16-1353]
MKKSVAVLLLLALFVNLKAEDIMVLAAASLKYVLEDIKTEFLKTRPGDKIDTSYIASGKAYNQIINGAPAQLFIAADTSYPERLYKDNGAAEAPVNYVKGKLVLFSIDKNLKIDSLNILKDSKIKHIALPNPKLAPYGVAAQQSLESAKLWDSVQPKIVLGESIGQATQYVKSGGSEVGFSALSMVIKDKEANYLVVDEATYKPILQAMVITKYGKDSKLAKDFKDFILSPKAQEIFATYGYSKP